jgi:DNA-directed RNA polymerase specialized sigma24 family protein
MNPDRREVIVRLKGLRAPQRDGESGLLTFVNGELRRRAAAYLRRVHPNHTLQATAFVHEAFLRMARSRCLMAKASAFLWCRGGRDTLNLGRRRARRSHSEVRLGLGIALVGRRACHLKRTPTSVDQPLRGPESVGAINLGQTQVVGLRFVVGFSVEETAEAFGCASQTVSRFWRMEQAWLRRELPATYSNEC